MVSDWEALMSVLVERERLIGCESSPGLAGLTGELAGVRVGWGQRGRSKVYKK